MRCFDKINKAISLVKRLINKNINIVNKGGSVAEWPVPEARSRHLLELFAVVPSSNPRLRS